MIVVVFVLTYFLIGLIIVGVDRGRDSQFFDGVDGPPEVLAVLFWPIAIVGIVLIFGTRRLVLKPANSFIDFVARAVESLRSKNKIPDARVVKK